MKLFSKLRLRLGERALRKRAVLVKRNRKVHNFTTAGSAGIIFDATVTRSFPLVKSFGKFLNSMNISTLIIGYVNSDEIPGELILWDKCEFFKNKDIDILYRPRKEQVLSFIDTPFDILFDLSLNSHFPIRYIVSLSSASFKVGNFSEQPNDYDLMISMGEKKSLEYLIEQITHYVGLLNNPAEPVKIK